MTHGVIKEPCGSVFRAKDNDNDEFVIDTSPVGNPEGTQFFVKTTSSGVWLSAEQLGAMVGLAAGRLEGGDRTGFLRSVLREMTNADND